MEYLNIMPLKSKYLEEVSILSNLTRLDITKGDIVNLDFIKGLNKLEKLELYYLRKLSCISGIEKVSNSIKDLSIVSCKNIKSLVPLKKLVNLKRLELTKVRIEDLEFLNGISKLEKLLIMETNIDSGDLSPATNIPWISINNKKQYNYICDYKKNILIPKIVKKTKMEENRISIPYFGEIELKNLNEYYDSSIQHEDGNISIDMNFEEENISKSNLKIVEHILAHSPADLNKEMVQILKSVPQHESIVIYQELIEDEFELTYSNTEGFLDTLELKRIGFYPHSDDEAVVFDMQPKGLELDHLICLLMDGERKIYDISIES